MNGDDELAAIRERFRELDALNDAENPDDRDRFDKALRVRAWACAWDVEPLLEEVERLKVQLSNYAHDRDEARRERDEAIAHDRQAYPTPDAYERACAAHHKHRQRADLLGAAIKELKDLAYTCPEDDPEWLTDLRKRVMRWADEALAEDAELRARKPELNGEPWAFIFAERDRLRARVAELEAQRDKVLALCEEIECSNCGHAVKLHDASPTGECTQDHMKTRACGCDWSHPIADDIRAVYAEPATAETTADQQARDEADLADINRRVAAERKALEAAKAWRAALKWESGVPRDTYAKRLADTQDALCMAVDGLPGEREGGA